MQHLYTRYSETYSSLRNVFARLRQSVLANSLRTIILIFVLALSCNVWGEVYTFDFTKATKFPTLTAEKNNAQEILSQSSYTLTSTENADVQMTFTIGISNLKGNARSVKFDQSSGLVFERCGVASFNLSQKADISITIGKRDCVFGADPYYGQTYTADTYQKFNQNTTPLAVGNANKTTTIRECTPGNYKICCPNATGGNWALTKITISYTAPSTKTIYLNTGVWNTANPVFVAHSYAGSSTVDIVMEKCADDCSGSIYKAEVPASHTNVIFLREKTGTADNWWNCDNLWNRTAELTLSENSNLFTITDWNNGGTYTCNGNRDYSNGTWGTYVQSFSVSFNMNGHGNAVSDQCVQSGAAITQPADPTATGYTFAGWYADAACTQAWDFSTPVTAATTLYAKWTEDLTSPVSIKGAWDEWAEHPLEKKPGETGNVAYITLSITQAKTYQFGFLYKGTFYQIPAQNAQPMTRLTANEIGWDFYKSGAITDGGTADCKIEIDYTGDYTFKVDYSDENWLKVTVTYPAPHTITYQEGRPAEYGSLTTFGIPTSTTQVADGGALTLPDYTTIKIAAESGNITIYKFAGWSDGKTTYPANQTTIDNITSDLTLTATWQPVSFNIYYWDGQNEDNSQNKAISGLTPTTYTYASNDPLPTDAAAITDAAGKQGVVFKNWKVRDWDQTTFTLKDLDYTTPHHLYGDINLYAEWKKETILYTDTYIWNSNSKYGGCVDKPGATANANQGKAYTEKDYSSSTIGGGSSMGRPNNVGEYSITIAAQPGYLIQSICTYGKVETASQISWDKGITWTDLATYTEQKKVFTAPTGGAETFIIKCTTTKSGSGGIWWRNALVTLIEGLVCTPLTTFAWSVPSATYTYGEPFTAPKLSVQSGIETILYASSDASVATIAPDGTLTPKMPGTTTISATYEGDDFCPTTVTYTLNVVCNATAPKIVSDGTETTVGCAQTITLHAVQSTDETAYTAGTFQWYRDGEELPESTDATIVVKVPGNYTVAYNNGVCSVMSTNTAKVTASGSVPEVTRLARYQYFRVSGAYLESQKMRHLFRVKPTATGTPCKITVKAVQNNTETDVTGLANVTDYVSFVDNNDGTYDVMLDLNKLQTTGAITGTLSEGDILVFSCAPATCTDGTFDDAYAKSIDVRVLGADKKALAFIVSGADGEGSKDKKNHVVGGDFIDGVNKADLYLQTGHYTVDRNQELPLLTTLKRTYHVDPVNGYAAFDPMNYEPYDLIVLTDFPQASKSTEAAKNLDAIGNMVDVRPMLSLKAHMVRDNLSNGIWKTQKGFTENAATPDPTKQTVMSILCYAHSMFDGFDSKELLDGTTWTQTDSTNALTNIMVDKDQNIYIRMLTKGGFEDSKSLQGFTAVASENFINIGTIPDKTHTSLITCCERQANLEARLMLLSINSHATSLLTEVGMKAIERILTYLLVTDPTKVSDCSIVFDNGFNPDGTSRVGCTKHDGMWNTSENWNSGLTPLPTQNVQIKADVTVVGQATAADVKIQPTKKLTIAPNGALSTNGIIGWLDPKNNATISAITDPTVITVQANENNTGALIQSDKEGKTQATIQMYSRAKGTDKGNGMVENAVWQWMTTPYKDVTHAVNTYRGAWLYTYNNSTHSWQQIYDQSPVPPFAGYSITQAQAKTYTMTGTLVPTADQTISLSNGINLIGNSWTAPINISQFKVEDFANAEATIVMFNTGIDPDGSGAVYTDENSTASQTYVSIPVNAAIAINELKVIPAMQAFQVKATAEGATLTLDYDRLVRTKQVGNSPMRTPKHNAQTLGNGINERLRISVIGKRYSDYLYLLSHEEATEGFDNGWDGEKIYSDNLNVPVIYVENAAGDWQISTQPVLAGTQFGFYRGEDDVYTICFDYVGDETLYFYDAVADTYTEVKTGNTYSFISTTDGLERRFALTNFNPYVKPTPTDIDNTDAHSARMIRKFVLNDHVYILIDGVLYDVVGKMVR